MSVVQRYTTVLTSASSGYTSGPSFSNKVRAIFKKQARIFENHAPEPPPHPTYNLPGGGYTPNKRNTKTTTRNPNLKKENEVSRKRPIQLAMCKKNSIFARRLLSGRDKILLYCVLIVRLWPGGWLENHSKIFLVVNN